MHSRPSRLGFTLVELMIALFIALIIFTIGMTTINGAIGARREAEARIHAAENARLLFQMLEKDLSSAYPEAGISDTITPTLQQTDTGIVMSVNGKSVTVPASDRIQLMTRVDHRDVTDQYVFIRYFVNTHGHLCREVNPSTTSPSDAAIPPDVTNDDFAMFDQTYSMQVTPARWDSTNKVMLPRSGDPPILWNQATHIRVSVWFFGYNGSSLAIDTSPTKRVYQKTLELPQTFQP